MSRFLKIALLSLGCLLLVILAVVAFLVTTETGTRFLVTRLLPGSVQVRAIDGRLIGPLVVHGAQLDTPALSATIERAELQWRPAGALSGTLLVQRLQVDGVTVTTMPAAADEPQPASEPFELPPEMSTPISLQLQELQINDLEYRASPEAEPVVIDTISLSAGASGNNFEVGHFEVSAPMFDISVTAQVSARGDYPLEAGIDATLRPEGLAPLYSTTRLDGSLKSLRIHEVIDAPYALEADATISDPFSELRLDASVTLSAVNPHAIREDLPQAVLNLQAQAEGTPAELAIRAKLDANYEEQNLTVELDTSLEGDELSLETLSATMPGHATRIDGRGRIKLAGDFATDVSLQWQDLKWPLSDDPDYRSASGEATVSGTLDGYTLSAEAALTLPGDVPMEARVSAEGSREHLDVELRVDALDGRIDGTAAVSWVPSLEADVTLEGSDVDPAAFAPDWPGQLDFTLRAAAGTSQQATRARLETLTVNGALRGQPLTLDGEGTYQNGELVLDRLRGRLGATRIMAEGRYAETADLEWRIENDDLGELLPGAAGEVTSEGTLTGSPPQLVIDATLNAAEVAYQENRIEELALTADVDLTDRNVSSVDLRIEGLETPALSAATASVTIDGRLAEHSATVVADTSQGRADLQLEGELREPWSGDPSWLFRLTDATLAYPELRPWTLRSVAEGRLAAGEVKVGRHCWASDPAELCLSGERTAERLQAEFTLEQLGFGYFAAFMPAALALDGELSGSGKLTQAKDSPLQADVNLQTGNGRLGLRAEQAEGDGETSSRTLLDLQPSRVSLQVDGNAASASANLVFGQGRIELQAELAASDEPLAERSVDGRLLVDVPDIAFVASLVPDVENLQGNVGGQLEFAGTLQRPLLSGRIALEDAALASRAAGIALSELEFALDGRGDDGIGLDASMVSGGGNLELAGTLGLGQESAKTSIEISGEDFQLLGNEQARVFVSPDLEVDADAEQVRIGGSVTIPRADITPRNLPESAVTASDDVLVVSPEANEDADAVEDPTGRPVHAEVKIVLGDEVRFEGFGLTARFEGDTTVIQEPGQPTSATGEITIAEGEYRAYGQGLVIESGRILFAGGPVTEPALDVRAVRRPAEGILVGSRVRGTLEQPEFTLFSEPSMSQQEQLSWLVLGRSLGEAPAGESSALAQASLALGVKGGNFLAGNIGGNLGVDEFGIQSGSGEAGAASDPADAAFVIGKYLSPKLYLSYGIGLFNPVSVLKMQYEINRRLELVTESSSDSTGADLVYTFERGE